MKIIVDAFGGDNAPLEIIKGCAMAVEKFDDVEIILAGDEETIRKVKAATAQFTGLKIAVMGCIVNGPGEMADADYGYVGAGRERISLYRGKECVLKNIPQEEAVEQLLALIESDKNAQA